MSTKAFPGPQGAITPVAGPPIPQREVANGISLAVNGVVRRKRGPAGRETTHPLTINFPQRPLVKLEEPSVTTVGYMISGRLKIDLITDQICRATVKHG